MHLREAASPMQRRRVGSSSSASAADRLSMMKVQVTASSSSLPDPRAPPRVATAATNHLS